MPESVSAQRRRSAAETWWSGSGTDGTLRGRYVALVVALTTSFLPSSMDVKRSSTDLVAPTFTAVEGFTRISMRVLSLPAPTFVRLNPLVDVTCDVTLVEPQ